METKVERLYLCDGKRCSKKERQTCFYDLIDFTKDPFFNDIIYNNCCRHTNVKEHSLTQNNPYFNNINHFWIVNDLGFWVEELDINAARKHTINIMKLLAIES